MATLRRLLWGLGVFTLAGVYLAVVSVSYRTRPSLDAGYLLLHGDDQPRQDGARGSHGNDEQLADALQHLGKELTRHTDGTLVIEFNCATRRHVRPDDDLPPPPSAAAALFEWASAANEALRVLNEDLFGSLEERPPQRVIVVQVHRRERYARWLLQSLAAVPGIESALLVLSHGHVDDALLGLAREVCFCRVARVFFPWSTQMWADCVNGSAAEGGRPCRRGPAFTDAKHHWWWLHNFVFNKVLDAAKYKGVTLFLEEDMYLSPDALHVLDRMQLAVPAADMYALSDDDGLLSASRHRLVLQGHRVYNMGLALHERAWAKIVRCASMFCSLDDYNWDWSLQAVGVRCVPGRFTTATMRGARLFHTGKCGGMHFHGAADCDSLVLHARRLLQQNAELLFPDALTVQQSDRLPAVGRGNGGWTDRRDQQLCLDNANASLHRWVQ